MDGVENIYFFVDFQATPKLNVDVAPTNDLTAVVPCGSIGEDPGAVTSCVAYEGEDPSTVTVSLNEGPLASFGVAVDGVAVNPADIETLFADIPGPAVVTGYQVPALLTSAITITQAGGDVDCTGDEANFCTQFAGSLEWLSVADIWNDEYNVRRVNADGSTTWVRTNIGEQASSALAGPGDYLIRYRIEDAQGNQTVFDNVCVPN